MGTGDRPQKPTEKNWAAIRRESHAGLRRELVRRSTGGATDLANSSMQIDPLGYTDPALLQRERSAFQRLPILAALSLDLPQPGDKLLFDALGPEILLVRNRAGVVNAFRNLCTHRAARVVRECDRRAHMTCPFHGWTFDLDGRLTGLPGADGFADMDREARSFV
jgi:phenylpropionate dioxygenase-like ring-hydroxylating dioxygenase large terminal subunit